MNIDELVRYAGGLEAVVWVKPYNLLCSKEGGERVAQEIKEHRLTLYQCKNDGLAKAR